MNISRTEGSGLSSGLIGLPDKVYLLSQVIHVTTVENLHHTEEEEWVHDEDGTEHRAEAHPHRAFGVYEEVSQTITLDDSLGFEKARETFVHENIHTWLAATQLDSLIDGASGTAGLTEHLVSALAPVVLAWVRDNPDSMLYLRETQL